MGWTLIKPLFYRHLEGFWSSPQTCCSTAGAGRGAFVANCWNIFCRLGGDGSHHEAVTTRRQLQSCVARITSHGRRKTVTIFTCGKSVARRIFGEGKFGKLKSRALAMLKKHGGSLDRSTFLKNLSVDLKTFKNLVATLIASELIETESVTNGKVVHHAVNVQ